jgi:hypothetical protein
MDDNIDYLINNFTEDVRLLEVGSTNCTNELTYSYQNKGLVISPVEIRGCISFNECLLKQNHLTIFYMINTQGYVFLNDLHNIKTTNWVFYLKRLEDLDIIQRIERKDVKNYIRSQKGCGEYHSNKAVIYSFTNKGQDFYFSNIKVREYIDRNVDSKVMKYLSGIQDKFIEVENKRRLDEENFEKNLLNRIKIAKDKQVKSFEDRIILEQVSHLGIKGYIEEKKKWNK